MMASIYSVPNEVLLIIVDLLTQDGDNRYRFVASLSSFARTCWRHYKLLIHHLYLTDAQTFWPYSGHYAIWSGNVDMMERILDAHGNRNYPLHPDATKSWDPEPLVPFVNRVYSSGWPIRRPKHLAPAGYIRWNDQDQVDDRPADIFRPYYCDRRSTLDSAPEMLSCDDYSRYSLLHLAAYYNEAAIIGLLLDRGANIDQAGCYMCNCCYRDIALQLNGNNNGPSAAYTPLHLAICTASLAAAKHLLQRGADTKLDRPRCTDREPHRPGHSELPDAGNDVCGITALHLACRAGPLSLVQYIVEHGFQSDLNVRDESGQTPIHYACEFGNYCTIVPWLIANGADINVFVGRVRGIYPNVLHVFCAKSEYSHALRVLDYGADPHCRDLLGRLPVELVITNCDMFRPLMGNKKPDSQIHRDRLTLLQRMRDMHALGAIDDGNSFMDRTLSSAYCFKTALFLLDCGFVLTNPVASRDNFLSATKYVLNSLDLCCSSWAQLINLVLQMCPKPARSQKTFKWKQTITRVFSPPTPPEIDIVARLLLATHGAIVDDHCISSALRLGISADLLACLLRYKHGAQLAPRESKAILQLFNRNISKAYLLMAFEFDPQSPLILGGSLFQSMVCSLKVAGSSCRDETAAILLDLGSRLSPPLNTGDTGDEGEQSQDMVPTGVSYWNSANQYPLHEYYRHQMTCLESSRQLGRRMLAVSDVNSKNHQGCTPLFEAMGNWVKWEEQSPKQFLLDILQLGADIHAENEAAKKTPLDIAILGHHKQLVTWMLEMCPEQTNRRYLSMYMDPDIMQDGKWSIEILTQISRISDPCGEHDSNTQVGAAMKVLCREVCAGWMMFSARRNVKQLCANLGQITRDEKLLPAWKIENDDGMSAEMYAFKAFLAADSCIQFPTIEEDVVHTNTLVRWREEVVAFCAALFGVDYDESGTCIGPSLLEFPRDHKQFERIVIEAAELRVD